MKKLQGTWTALITPFHSGKVDLTTLERLVEHQLAAGIDGLVPCGTTGETPTLTLAEMRSIITLVAKRAGKTTPVFAGAGSNDTAKTLELVRLAEDCGATGLLLVAPYYNRPPQAGLYGHFATIAAATKLPIMVYNIPGRAGVELSVETLARLRAEFPGIVAVKHATGSVLGAADLAAATDLPIFSGDDPLTLPLMALGAVGVVSVVSNLAPRTARAITAAALAGDWEAARAAHAKLYPLARALLALDTNPIPVKTALSLRGLGEAEFRLPLCPMAAEGVLALKSLLAAHPLD
ncbi:MAG: 4-hydroxy-tetrahydrodipicolinate synthase [Phycisphaerales bacterium]|nr:4-hydroxy-tetrahydrodipicolinate synthase [Phycisphaerales bacterium]